MSPTHYCLQHIIVSNTILCPHLHLIYSCSIFSLLTCCCRIILCSAGQVQILLLIFLYFQRYMAIWRFSCFSQYQMFWNCYRFFFLQSQFKLACPLIKINIKLVVFLLWNLSSAALVIVLSFSYKVKVFKNLPVFKNNFFFKFTKMG